MKLYVKDEKDRIVYINKVAATKSELQVIIGKREFHVLGKKYSISQVKATKNTSDMVTGAIVGGVVGSFVGPLGVAIGGITGCVIGRSTDIRKQRSVETFNKSGVEWQRTKK